MSIINKSIAINAPVSKVFDVVTAPDNWTRYVTSLAAVKNMSKDIPQKGSTFHWEYKMMGIGFSGDGTVTEYTKNKKFGLKLKGKVEIDESYQFVKNDDGSTTLQIRIDYEMPSHVLKVIADTKLAQKLNAIESKNVLSKIKAMCEA